MCMTSALRRPRVSFSNPRRCEFPNLPGKHPVAVPGHIDASSYLDHCGLAVSGVGPVRNMPDH